MSKDVKKALIELSALKSEALLTRATEIHRLQTELNRYLDPTSCILFADIDATVQVYRDVWQIVSRNSYKQEVTLRFVRFRNDTE